MHALSVAALALGATVVSAQSCAPYCQFPKSITCPGTGLTLTKDQVVAAAVNGDRSGSPRETSAANLATRHCSGLSGIPLWTAELPNGSGTLFYALDSKGTYYFCSTMSGIGPSGWPDSCTENN